MESATGGLKGRQPSLTPHHHPQPLSTTNQWQSLTTTVGLPLPYCRVFGACLQELHLPLGHPPRARIPATLRLHELRVHLERDLPLPLPRRMHLQTERREKGVGLWTERLDAKGVARGRWHGFFVCGQRGWMRRESHVSAGMAFF